MLAKDIITVLISAGALFLTIILNVRSGAKEGTSEITTVIVKLENIQSTVNNSTSWFRGATNIKVSAKKFRLYCSYLTEVTSAVGVGLLNFYGQSYSEEEFGSEGITMLYDNGVELVNFANSDYVYTGFTVSYGVKDPSEVKMNGVGTSQVQIFGTANQIDLNQKSYITAVIDSLGMKNTSISITMRVIAAKETAITALSNLIVGALGTDLRMYLDIKTINQLAYIYIYVCI